MNILFLILTISSLLIITITNPDNVLKIMIDGGKSAFDLSIKMIAIYSIWSAMLELIKKTNLDKKITSLLEPVINYLYKGESQTAKSYISLNMTANLLGMGGAATPLGIKSINTMKKANNEKIATNNMLLFFVLNATSLQFIPATVISLRAAAASIHPSDILFPNILVSIISAGSGFIVVKLLSKFSKTL